MHVHCMRTASRVRMTGSMREATRAAHLEQKMEGRTWLSACLTWLPLCVAALRSEDFTSCALVRNLRRRNSLCKSSEMCACSGTGLHTDTRTVADSKVVGINVSFDTASWLCYKNFMPPTLFPEQANNSIQPDKWPYDNCWPFFDFRLKYTH